MQGVDLRTGMTLPTLRKAYNKLQQMDPETREAEEERLRDLQVVEQSIAELEIATIQNYETCKWAVMNGIQKLPSEMQSENGAAYTATR